MATSFEEMTRPELVYLHEYDAQEVKDQFFIINNEEEEEEEDDDDDYDGTEEEEEEEAEFSFMSSSFGDLSLVPAEEAFVDGQIKPVMFPLFNRELLVDDQTQTSYSNLSKEDLPKKPPVKRVFVVAQENNHQIKNRGDHDQTTPSSSSEGDVISGPCCDLTSRKVVEVASSSSSSDACKKSNSTGFSKIWRFKDLVSRSHSDGRDAFVFLNEPHHHHVPLPTPTASGEKRVVVDPSAEKVKVNNGKVGGVVAGGRRRKPYSAHEVYMRNKGEEAKKKRASSYLPYRPELMGFFTSVNSGGFSRNVHPY